MRKITGMILDMLTLILLAGAYFIQYFTMRKLGMNRWVMYHQMKYQRLIAVDLWKNAAVLLALVLALLVLRSFCRRKKRSFGGWLRMVILFLLVIFYAGFTAVVSMEKMRSYYLMLPLIGLSVVIQTARMCMVVWNCEKKDR